MANFIGFCFGDNDFHRNLEKAIIYVQENKTEELTLENHRIAVAYATAAFMTISNVDNYTFEKWKPSYHLDYVVKTLKVSVVQHYGELKKLYPYFEGFVLDTNTGHVFFFDSEMPVD